MELRMKKLSLIVFAFMFSVTAMTGVMATSVEDFVSETLVNLGDTPPQDQIGQVIGQICPSGTIITNDDFQTLCGEIAGAGLSANPTARDGLQAMAPEENAVVASSQVDAGGAQIDNIGDRLSALRGGTAGGGLTYQKNSGYNWSGGAAGDGSSPWGFFVNGLYISSDRDSTINESGFEADDFGVTAGIDYAASDQLVVGAAFGYKNSDADIDNRGGNLDTDSYSFFGYFSYSPSEFWYYDACLAIP